MCSLTGKAVGKMWPLSNPTCSSQPQNVSSSRLCVCPPVWRLRLARQASATSRMAAQLILQPAFWASGCHWRTCSARLGMQGACMVFFPAGQSHHMGYLRCTQPGHPLGCTRHTYGGQPHLRAVAGLGR